MVEVRALFWLQCFLFLDDAIPQPYTRIEQEFVFFASFFTLAHGTGLRVAACLSSNLSFQERCRTLHVSCIYFRLLVYLYRSMRPVINM